MRDTIEMACEAELICSVEVPISPWIEDHDLTPHLKAFEALVRADAIANERDKWMERTAILIRGEREACAELVYNSPPSDEYESPLKAVYDAIRARGNT